MGRGPWGGRGVPEQPTASYNIRRGTLWNAEMFKRPYAKSLFTIFYAYWDTELKYWIIFQKTELKIDWTGSKKPVKFGIDISKNGFSLAKGSNEKRETLFFKTLNCAWNTWRHGFPANWNSRRTATYSTNAEKDPFPLYF